jgi:hypothetical protein
VLKHGIDTLREREVHEALGGQWKYQDDDYRHDRKIKVIVLSTLQVGKTKKQQALIAT